MRRLAALALSCLGLMLPGTGSAVWDDARVGREHAKLEADTAGWCQGIGSANELLCVDRIGAQQLNQALAVARQIGEARGLDMERLEKIYTLGKKVIRTGRFAVPDDPNAPSRWTSLPHQYQADEAEQQAARTQYRLRLMKRLTLAYLRVLMATADAPLPCPPERAGGGSAKIGGKDVPLAGCPDPVVEHLRRYVEAIRLVQSADRETLDAEIEEMIGEQQLVADIMAGFPLVGEAIDIYSLYSGETLAGQQLHLVERVFTATFLALPVLGPKAANYLGEALQRSPRAVEAMGRMQVWLEGVVEYGKWAGAELRDKGSDVVAQLAARWSTQKARLAQLKDELAEALDAYYRKRAARQAGKVPGEADWFIYRKLRDAAQDKVDIADLPEDWRRRAYRSAIDLFQQTLGPVQDEMTREARIAASGMVHAHGEAFSHVARERGEIFLVRPVNPAATELIARHAATKPMAIKPKSAVEGIIAGALPVDQALNKTGTALRETKRALAEAQPGSAIAEELASKAAKLEQGLAKGGKEIEKLRHNGAAIEIPFTRADGKVVHQVPRADGGFDFVVPDETGGWVHAESGAAYGSAAQPKPVLVLGDPETGQMLTADYDLLAFGEKGRHRQPGFSESQGFTTPAQREAIDDLNHAVQGRDPGFDPADFGGEAYRGGNVSHHGAEENFFASPGVEGDVITAYEPSGAVISIPKCDRACMENWCRSLGPSGRPRCDPRKLCATGQHSGCIPIDADRLLKDYFHVKRLGGWNLDPNPRWDWGPYNPLGGWLKGAHCAGCDDRLWSVAH